MVPCISNALPPSSPSPCIYTVPEEGLGHNLELSLDPTYSMSTMGRFRRVIRWLPGHQFRHPSFPPTLPTSGEACFLHRCPDLGRLVPFCTPGCHFGRIKAHYHGQLQTAAQGLSWWVRTLDVAA